MKTLQKDIVALNRRFMLVVKQMSELGHPMLTQCCPAWLAEKLAKMTIEEIDALAEDMVAPCFHIGLPEAAFDAVRKMDGTLHSAYFANVLSNRVS